MKRTLSKALWIIAAIALFAFLSEIIIDPTFSSAPLYPAFLLLTVVCYFLGPMAGAIVGGVGWLAHFLMYFHFHWDVLARVFPRFIGPVIGAAAAGLTLGLLFRLTRQFDSSIIRLLLNLAAVVLSSALGFWLVTSLVDAAAQGWSLQTAIRRNMDAFVSNGLMLLAGVPLAMALDGPVRKAAPGFFGAADAGAGDPNTNPRKDENNGGI